MNIIDNTEPVKDISNSSKASINGKLVPNIYGKTGGLKHQKVKKWLLDMSVSENFELRKKITLKIPNVIRNNRIADVAKFDKLGNITEIHQIGRLTKSGRPVSREMKAL